MARRPRLRSGGGAASGDDEGYPTMTTTAKDLRDKRVRLADAANQILTKAHLDGQEILKPDDEETWTRIHVEIDALERHITMIEKQAKLAQALEDPEARLTEPSPPRASDRASATMALRHFQAGQADAQRALRTWLLASPTSGYQITADDRALAERAGVSLLAKQLDISFSVEPMRSLVDRRSWEYRAQGTLTGAGGGFTVPDELMRSIEVALLTYGGMRQAATILRTATGAALPIPTVNDTTQTGVILSENTQVANQDVVFAQLVLDAYKYSSKQVLVSVELLQDSAVPLGQMLGTLLGERIGRITNTHFTVGTGTAQPMGIVPAATVGFTAPTGQATSWTYASMVELEHSVDPAYRRNGTWMMADSSLKKTKQLVDTQGRPLWAASIQTGAPDTLLGYPVIINQDVAAMAANAKSVVFGDLSKYLIRDVLGVTLLRLEERYADFHQVAFLAFARMDGDLLNAGTNPVKVFTNSAT
jgi:HK97 family phage major capsid protein